MTNNILFRISLVWTSHTLTMSLSDISSVPQKKREGWCLSLHGRSCWTRPTLTTSFSYCENRTWIPPPPELLTRKLGCQLGIVTSYPPNSILFSVFLNYPTLTSNIITYYLKSTLFQINLYQTLFMDWVDLVFAKSRFIWNISFRKII